MTRRRRPDPADATWQGATRDYDLVKEFVVALLAISLLTLGLAALLGSPDVRQVTLAGWANAAPNDFVATAATELDGTSHTAGYGAPYTDTPGAAQRLGPVSLQHLAGVTAPVDTVHDFVVGPLQHVGGDPALGAALSAYAAAPAARRQAWAAGYDAALGKAPGGDPARVVPGDYGPVPVLLDRLLLLARSGGLDGILLSQGNFYQTDYTKPLLFLADGSYLEDLARRQHLGGNQWGMMNETGSYPGQAWLWLYTFWYQVKPFSTSGNADALVWSVMAALSALFVLLPFVPGLRSVPRYLPVHRLIWRDYYRQHAPTGQ